jgi:hypothetical protein
MSKILPTIMRYESKIFYQTRFYLTYHISQKEIVGRSKGRIYMIHQTIENLGGKARSWAGFCSNCEKKA